MFPVVFWCPFGIDRMFLFSFWASIQPSISFMAAGPLPCCNSRLLFAQNLFYLGVPMLFWSLQLFPHFLPLNTLMTLALIKAWRWLVWIWFGLVFHIAFQSVLLKQNLLHVFSALSAASSMTQHTMPEFSCCLSEWRSAQFFLCCIHHYNILLSRVECSKQTQTYGLYWVNNPLGSKFVLSGIH